MDKINIKTILIISFILFIPIMLLDAFVVCKLWEWFISNLFNLKSLNMKEAIGLILFIEMFKTITYREQEDELIAIRECIGSMIFRIFLSIIILILGFLINLF